MNLSAILSKSNDLAMAGLVVAIVSLMILPLPALVIDSLLAVNISASVVLLMTAMFIPNAIALSTFPSLLLFTTLFRLSLNIASTKAILLHAEAGHIIDSFGQLVVGGNLVVGIVVFLIITIVQFIVISKGSERVAEVGARFTLDAMPGKQMSIDADLRAGLMTGEEARKKRALLSMESQMHGGMDGAMKFVKGDSIAGLIITLVNLLAGVVVGVMYHGMTAGDAANRFAVLSIGDAMVSQIPSLFICVAAGVLITRVADEHAKEQRSLGQEIVQQLSNNSMSMFLAAALIVAFAAVPGFPALQFLMIAGALIFVGKKIQKRDKGKEGSPTASKPIDALKRDGSKADAPAILQQPPSVSRPLSIRLSRTLVDALDAEALGEALKTERDRLQLQLGMPFPGVSMWVADELKNYQFDLLLNDVPLWAIDLPKQMVLLRSHDHAVAAQAEVRGPVGGRPHSLWLTPQAASAAPDAEIWPIEQVIAAEAISVLRTNAHLLMGIQEVQWVIERATADYPGLVAEVQKILPLQRIAEVMRRLLEEQIPIRNLRSIFESLVIWGPKEKDMLLLTEYVRGDLGRYLAHEASAGTGAINAVLLEPGLEQMIRQCIKPTPAGNFLAMPPEAAQAVTDQICQMVGEEPQIGMALITSMDIRRYVRKMIEGRLQWLRVYSYQELGTLAELRPVGRVAV